MNKKVTNDNQPATQKDLETWGGNLAFRLEAVERRLDTMVTKEDLKRFATTDDLNRFATKEDLARFSIKIENGFKQVIDHIDVAVENRQIDLGAAKKEDLSLLHNKTDKIAERVRFVERHVGIPTPE